ncbi:hypothetical protein Tco_0385154 [Tanacetum coccineum]
MTKAKSFNKNTKHKALYHALIESILEDNDVMDKGVADKSMKRNPGDVDRYEDPPAGSNQGLKRKKTSKDTKPSKNDKSIETSKGTIVAKIYWKICTSSEDSADLKDWFKKPERPLTPDPDWNKCKTLLKGTCRCYIKLEYNMKECYKELNDQLDWNNPEGDRYTFDLSKPLPLVQSRNHQIVPVDYFFNNDLAYLHGESTSRTYTTSLTKTKAAKYDLQGIEDMVPNLWSPIKVAYNIHALLGTSHWRSKRQTFHGYASNRVSKHDVYSTKRILAVTNVKVNIWYGYGHLERIKVQRSDQQLYKLLALLFSEAGVLYVNWTRLGHYVSRRGYL